MELFKSIKEILSHNGQWSSKRVFGGLGFIVCIYILIYCTLNVIQAPTFADVVLVACMALMGVDSVTDIWKNERK